MADTSIIAQVMQLDQQKKLQEQNAPMQNMQGIMQAVMNGIQIYDSIKGLGSKYGSTTIPGTPGEPAVGSVTTPGASLSSQITPRTAFPSTIQDQTASPAPGLQALLGNMGRSQAAPAIPGTPAQTLPSAEILSKLAAQKELLTGTQGTGVNQALGTIAKNAGMNVSGGIEATPKQSYIPVKQPDGTFVYLPTSMAIENKKAEVIQSEGDKNRENRLKVEREKAAATAATKAKEKEVSAAKVSWKKLLDVVAKGDDVPPEILKAGVAAGDKLGEDTSVFKEPKKPGFWKEKATELKEKMFAEPKKGKVTFKTSSGTVRVGDYQYLETYKKNDPGLTILSE